MGGLCAAGVFAAFTWWGGQSVPHAHAAAAESDFVGAAQCQTCHQEQYDAWKAGPHAGALGVLSKVQKKKMGCRQCHTTAPASAQADLEGVQCETCHGAGRWYVPENVMRDSELRALLGLKKVDTAVCLDCHSGGTSLKPWNMDEKLEAIRHWKPKPAPQ